MRAYAVFDGGGVKGTALAGALAAAQDNGIDFAGYGGTSAGSIVALLAAVGYSGKEIRDLLVSISFNEFLDGRGGRLRVLREKLDFLLSISRHSPVLRKLRALGPFLHLCREFSNGTVGVDSGQNLRRFLHKCVRSKIQSMGGSLAAEIAGKHSISFADLRSLDLPLLRVVASNITSRRAVVLPDSSCSLSSDVVAAVMASAAYPIAFRPLVVQHELFVDGGVASNLPSFLFAHEAEETRLVTLAFDLVSSNSCEPPTGLIDFSKRLLDTALEASDELLRGLSDNIKHVPIVVPPGVSTLDFDIDGNERERLADSGYVQACQILLTYQPLLASKGTGSDLRKTLIAQFGPPDQYTIILQALIRDIEEVSQAKDVRAHIMLVTGRRTRIVVYEAGMNEDPDFDLELEEDAGCSGQAWMQRDIIAYADLQEAAKNPSLWKMSDEQHRKIPTSRKSMLSVAIPGKSGTWGESTHCVSSPVGTLSIDSTTLLADTGWVGDQGEIDATVSFFLGKWASIVARVLP